MWVEGGASLLCPGTSVFQEVLEFGVHKGEAGKRRLVHGVDKVLVAVGEARLLVQELLVEVAVVSGGLLQAEGRGERTGRREWPSRHPRLESLQGWARPELSSPRTEKGASPSSLKGAPRERGCHFPKRKRKVTRELWAWVRRGGSLLLRGHQITAHGGQISLTICFCGAHKLRMAFAFLSGWKKKTKEKYFMT